MSTYKMFKFFSRKFQSNEKAPPVDVQTVFACFAGVDSPRMEADQLLRFLVEHQGETNATIGDAKDLIERLRCGRSSPASSPTTPPITKPVIFLDDFQRYLFCCELNPPIRSEVHHDMTAPISHYYVYTGHNSYLTGNQLSSESSDLPIRKALERGVRVIELDMWPNSAKDNIQIFHGRTLTSPVTLGKCLRSIKETAFTASEYPVVITLEDHLTPDLQAKVAKMVMETFGETLSYPETELLEQFPSPEDLKKRIIISTKPPKEYLEAKMAKDNKATTTQKGKTEPEDEWGKGVSELKSEPDDSDDKNDLSQSDQDDDDGSDEDEQKSIQNAAPEYRHIITIMAGKPKGGLRTSLMIDPNKVKRLSLSENQLEKAAEVYGVNLVRFTQKNILRIYPKGTRVTSSNYNPLIGWMHGAQMVAFNMQGYGKSLWLMQGLFRSNGGCGYVKKPDFLMNPENIFNPNANLPVKKTLKVKVYMGDGWDKDFSKTHFDTFSPPDFYTRVGIAGVPADNKMEKTKVVDDDWSPVWNEEFQFQLRVPELALLRVEVHEHDMSGKDDFGGQTCLPVAELRPGFRALPLYNRKGEKYKAVKLLIRFQFFQE